MDPQAMSGGQVANLDVLTGAAAIAAFLFGSSAYRKKVYDLAEKSQLPVFRLGSIVCARKSVLIEWIEAQERKAVANGP